MCQRELGLGSLRLYAVEREFAFMSLDQTCDDIEAEARSADIAGV